MLNGYETTSPFGKQAKLVDIVILSSALEETTHRGILETLKKTHHIHAPTFIGFAPLAYAVFREVYPHEKDFLVVDVSGEATEIAFVKHGLLMSVMTTPIGVNRFKPERGGLVQPPQIPGAAPVTPPVTTAPRESEWIEAVAMTLRIFSEGQALPRTLFLLADDDVRERIRTALDDAALRTLWLSDEPLTIIPVVPSHFIPYVGIGTEAQSDIFLMLLALLSGKNVGRIGA
jgi:hypothetical protein